MICNYKFITYSKNIIFLLILKMINFIVNIFYKPINKNSINNIYIFKKDNMISKYIIEDDFDLKDIINFAKIKINNNIFIEDYSFLVDYGNNRFFGITFNKNNKNDGRIIDNINFNKNNSNNIYNLCLNYPFPELLDTKFNKIDNIYYNLYNNKIYNEYLPHFVNYITNNKKNIFYMDENYKINEII
jgi:hypothetical protein